MTASDANVAASTIPAEVMTPAVMVSPRRTPSRVPCRIDSSLTRVMRKML